MVFEELKHARGQRTFCPAPLTRRDGFFFIYIIKREEMVEIRWFGKHGNLRAHRKKCVLFKRNASFHEFIYFCFNLHATRFDIYVEQTIQNKPRGKDTPIQLSHLDASFN